MGWATVEGSLMRLGGMLSPTHPRGKELVIWEGT